MENQSTSEYRKLFPSLREYALENTTYTLDPHMVFNEGQLVRMICYSTLFVISTIGNITVLSFLLRQKAKMRSRINYMLVHLTIADLLVTFILMPMEIVWAATVSWWAGDAACRIMQFFRTFGLYESSFVLVCIAIDRYNAVLKPLMLSAAKKTGRTLIKVSWIAAAVFSLPQTILFNVQPHPNHTWYEQCISGEPGTPELMIYSVLNMLIMYLIPLTVISYCYGSILREICIQASGTTSDKLRRSTKEFLSKAKTRTFRMTVTLILAFFTCWTPYYFITLWHVFLSWMDCIKRAVPLALHHINSKYFIDRQSMEKLDDRIHKLLYFFACTNSGINPIVYGVFNIRKQKTARQITRESNNTCTTEVRLMHLNGKKFDLLRRDSDQVVSTG